MTPSAGYLTGRRALVTGAASGIGAACASALAGAGAHVVAADVDEAGAEHIAAETGGEPWAVDLTDTAAHGVTSNCISPGYVRTPLVQTQIADQARLHGIAEDEVVATVLLAESAVKRLVEPAEVAELAVWLAGPSATMATGSSFTLDGGWTRNDRLRAEHACSNGAGACPRGKERAVNYVLIMKNDQSELVAIGPVAIEYQAAMLRDEIEHKSGWATVGIARVLPEARARALLDPASQ
jgi:hypothetical protein